MIQQLPHMTVQPKYFSHFYCTIEDTKRSKIVRFPANFTPGITLINKSRVVLTTVMTNIVVDKSSDNAEPLSICFLPQYSTPKGVIISEFDQTRDTTKEQSLSITFSQYDWFMFQNKRS